MAIVASTNDERAFGELIHRWERTILRVCRRVTGNREDAERCSAGCVLTGIQGPASVSQHQSLLHVVVEDCRERGL